MRLDIDVSFLLKEEYDKKEYNLVELPGCYVVSVVGTDSKDIIMIFKGTYYNSDKRELVTILKEVIDDLFNNESWNDVVLTNYFAGAIAPSYNSLISNKVEYKGKISNFRLEYRANGNIAYYFNSNLVKHTMIKTQNVLPKCEEHIESYVSLHALMVTLMNHLTTTDYKKIIEDFSLERK